MSVIPYKKIKELMEASKNGNPKAKAIMDKYLEEKPDYEAINRLMDDYYGNAGMDTLAKVEPMPEATPETVEPEEPIAPEGDVMGAEETFPEEPAQEVDVTIPEVQPVDITGDLDRELEGLIDEDEIEDLAFGDFLKNKKRDAMRAKKTAEYFRAFDPAGREKYISDKEGAYGARFDGNRRRIERGFNDMDSSLSRYGVYVDNLPEDDAQLDMGKVSEAYDALTGDEKAMGAFGRSWDDTDMQDMRVALSSLVAQYGKRNVIAVLNTLRDDNCAWRDFCNGKIDNAVGNYGKSLEKLLK